MTHAVSIVMPAFAAERTIVGAVASVIAQTHEAWELIVVADDATDYGAVLDRAGLADRRIKHLATGTVGGGSPVARNLGLDAASNRYSAILDADDRFHPYKLEWALAALEGGALVSTALRVTDAGYRPLRTVAAGGDLVLAPGEYKFVNFSMDSMLVYDRLAADPRFDPTLACLTDLDFVLRLFGKIKSCHHLGTPLHDYVKHPTSVSNKPGASERMVETKSLLLERLQVGYYPLAVPEAVGGFRRFIETSRAAERDFPDAAALRPGLLFEDHLETYLRGTS